MLSVSIYSALFALYIVIIIFNSSLQIFYGPPFAQGLETADDVDCLLQDNGPMRVNWTEYTTGAIIILPIL
jgi:hypothetical protein